MPNRTKSNPFHISPQYWKVSFTMSAEAGPIAENAFGGVALAVSAFATDDDTWLFELLCGEIPDMTEINQRLLVLSALCEEPTPKAVVQEIAAQDWLRQVARNFPPLTIGRFYVHGAHVDAPLATGRIPILVDAGAAFGSGEHGTTSCCLEALDWLEKQRNFRNILDMGCGSGILAIAAAKLWKTHVLAVDIDAVAVRVTRENAKLNRVTSLITAAESDGYQSEKIPRAKPFDLIISNILARPLIKFAPDLKQSLAKDGIAILSGLLTSQEAQVRSAHMAQGLKLKKRFVNGDWCTLVLQ